MSNFGKGTIKAIILTWGIHVPYMVNNYVGDGDLCIQLDSLIERYNRLSPLEQNLVLLKYTLGMKPFFDTELSNLIYPEIEKWGQDTKLFRDMLFAKGVTK